VSLFDVYDLWDEVEEVAIERLKWRFAWHTDFLLDAF
jgi:hypothetical protein